MKIYENADQQIEVHHVPESERFFPQWDLKTVKTNAPAPAAPSGQSRVSELMGRGQQYERSEPQATDPDRGEPNLGWC